MITAIAAGAILAFAQAGAPTMITLTSPTSSASDEQREVAFEAIADGRTDEAIATIEGELAQRPHDPALLINLAAAHQSDGDYQQAADAYRKAAESDERYLLELADGSWMDSRQAALAGLRTVQGRMLASR